MCQILNSYFCVLSLRQHRSKFFNGSNTMSSRYQCITINTHVSERSGENLIFHITYTITTDLLFTENLSQSVISLLFMTTCELITFHASFQSSQYSTFRQEDRIHFPGAVRQISLLEYVLNSDSSSNESSQFNITPPSTRQGLILVRPHNKNDNQKFTLCHYNENSSYFSLQSHHRSHKSDRV